MNIRKNHCEPHGPQWQNLKKMCIVDTNKNIVITYYNNIMEQTHAWACFSFVLTPLCVLAGLGPPPFTAVLGWA